jgi:hypothetical protein
MAQAAPKKRPFGATILAILAGILAVLAAIHTLQALGIFPYVIGPVKLHDFNLWNALMWGIMVYIYIWLVQMLWRVEPGHRDLQPDPRLHSDARIKHLVGCQHFVPHQPADPGLRHAAERAAGVRDNEGRVVRERRRSGVSSSFRDVVG